MAFYADCLKSTYFYPRSPCGERLLRKITVTVDDDFYPRSPCGERRSNGGTHYSYIYFYPRSPCGERP